MGAGGSKKTLAWGFAMAPHRLRALVLVLVNDLYICDPLEANMHFPVGLCSRTH